MPRSPRAWWRPVAALTFGLTGLAAPAWTSFSSAAAGAVPATATPSDGNASGAPATPAGTNVDASFVVGRARFEPLDGSLPLGADGVGIYRGSLEVVPSGGSMSVVNDVAVEDYVAGISEVPSNWPAAALQAQAIAARSYLLHNIARPSPAMAGVGAQICADQECQVYRGVAKALGPYGDRWQAAAAATAGQVLLYGGRPINAMYSSSNGGREIAGSEPYLQARDDPDDAAAPLDRWTATASASSLASALGLPGVVTQIVRHDDTVDVGWSSAPASSAPQTTTTAAPAATTSNATTTTAVAAPMPPGGSAPSGAPASTTTTTPPPPTTTAPAPTSPTTARAGSQGTASFGAGPFTRKVNNALPAPSGRDVLLPSDRFTVALDSGTATFSGGGFGHGIGMSQYGALVKAQRGESAADILAFYYSGLRPQTLPPSAVPPSVRVDVADGVGVTAITGRFRLVDEHGTVLIAVADGPWRVEPAPEGRVRVVLPDAYRAPFGLAPVTVEPAVLAPGTAPTLHFALPVPGLAAVTVTPPGGPATVTQLGITTTGPHGVRLPAPATTGTYTVSVAAVAGAGRQATATLDVRVGTDGPTTTVAGDRGRSGGSSAPVVAGVGLRPRPLHSMAGTVAVAASLLLGIGAVCITALRGTKPA